MPLTLNTPQVIQADIARITGFHVNAEQKALSVTYSIGYMNGEDFVVTEGKRIGITGDDFLALVSKPTTGKSLYEEIKTALYGYLNLDGTVT